MLLSTLSLITLTLSSQVIAGPSPPSFTQQYCYTKYDSAKAKSVPTSTSVYTLAVTFPLVVKSIATNTVTPSPITQTTTSVYTTTETSTATTMTDTSTVIFQPSTTVTSTATSTSTIASTSTATVTSTVMTSTLTVSATPAGYTPVASQLASAGVAYSRKRDSIDALSPVNKVEMVQRNALSKRGGNSNSYPQSVKCTQLVEQIVFKTVTVLAGKTSTVTAAPSTSTSTVTSTATSTSTVAPPNASTTVTVSAATSTYSSSTTIIQTSTVSTSTTTTVTADLPVATVYSSCQSNNLVTTVKGQNVDGVYDYNTGLQTNDAADGLACCQQCFTLAMNVSPSSCKWFYFQLASGQCTIGSNTNSPDNYLLYIGNRYQPGQMGNGGDGIYTGTTQG